MLLSCAQIVDGIDRVIDPFCGSGTVLLEAQTRGIESEGLEQNPVAALVSKVKITSVNTEELNQVAADVKSAAKRSRSRREVPSFIHRWYPTDVLSALSRLRRAIDDVEPGPIRDALLVVMTLTARRVSRADRRLPVPVRDRGRADARATAVWEWWDLESAAMGNRLAGLRTQETIARVHNVDSRDPRSWPSRPGPRSSLIFTSPPYGAAQKYIRSTSLDAAWLGMTGDRGTIELERQSIGREHLSRQEEKVPNLHHVDQEVGTLLDRIQAVDPMRAAVYGHYFSDMQSVISNASSSATGTLRVVLVAGTNTVCGIEVPTHEILVRMFARAGFERSLGMRDEIRGRALITARRSGARPAPAEYVDVLEWADAR